MDESAEHIPDDLSSLNTLEALREAIDQVDDQIHDLLMRRARLVLQVGAVKGREGKPVFYRPEREAKIHRRLTARHQGPLPLASLHRIYREIISASLSLEKPLNVVYLGPEATFTHQAALKHFGSSFSMYAAHTIDELFGEVETGRAAFGVVPVEDSSEGMVSHTLDRFVESPLRICAENLLPVVHNLLSSETDVSRVRVLYGHFQALEQCRGWINKHLDGVKVVGVKSTAQAAEYAAQEAGAAAVAGVYAADNYELNLLAEHIEDHVDNAIRFLVIGHQEPGVSGDDKSSLLLSFRDEAGFLHRLLGAFARHGINLTRIESRPSRKRAWDYVFFLDFEGHQSQPHVAAALKELGQVPGVWTRFLGSYPRAAI